MRFDVKNHAYFSVATKALRHEAFLLVSLCLRGINTYLTARAVTLPVRFKTPQPLSSPLTARRMDLNNT